MSNKRPLASKAEVKQKIKDIRDYHDQGRESLDLPSEVTIRQQAQALKWSETKLRKARQFAHPKLGYSEDRLDELCDLVLEHRPVFGTAHIGQLVTVSDWDDREELQRDCVENNWSLSELKLACKKQSAPRSRGGRRPKVTDHAVLIQLDDELTTYRRFVRELKRPRNGKRPILNRLAPKLRTEIRAFDKARKGLQKTLSEEIAKLRAVG
jgi:hypothetical protein